MLNFILGARNSNLLVSLSHLKNAFLYLSFYVEKNFRTKNKSRYSRSRVSTWPLCSSTCVQYPTLQHRVQALINEEIQVLEKVVH